MRILYITDCWTGLKDIIYYGRNDANGMPAFIKPLKEIINRGHTVDLYVIDNESVNSININPNNRGMNVVRVLKYHQNILLRQFDILVMKKEIRELLSNNHYDFVYGHGSAAGSVQKIIKEFGIPYGHRLYGTFLYDELEKNGILKTKIRRYIECSVFMKDKDFLLVTDDGTKGDKVFKMLNPGKEPFEFEFWLNGVDPVKNINKAIDLTKYSIQEDTQFLFYLARISRWKGQHKAIDLLKTIKEYGYNIKLVISGQVIDEDYFNEITDMINNYGLSNDVIFTGAIDRATAKELCKQSIASLSLYDLSNRGNVFYEYLSYGAIILSLNDGSLDDFIISGQNGFLVNNIKDGAVIIKGLLDGKYDNSDIRKRAQETYETKMLSWEERVDKEIELINSVIKKHSHVESK